MSQHAQLSPSGAERWLVCPGSVPLSETIPEPPSSPHAAEGTKAHDVGANLLLGNPVGVDVDVEMHDYMLAYAEEVRRRAAGNILLVEQRVSPEAVTGTKDNDGTADVVILDMENKHIEVLDLKYGKGVVKYAENNPQLMLYGLGVLCSFAHILEAETFKLTIYQPRRDHISEVELTREELLAFGEKVRASVSRVRSACVAFDDPKTTPANKEVYLQPDPDACRWCKAKATCPALNGAVQDAVFNARAEDDFPILDEPTAVKPEQMPTLPSPSRLELIEQWVSSVRDFIFQKLKGGEEVPGWKVVQTKKGSRRWQDTNAAEEQVKALRIKVGDAYDKKLKSPTQLQKVVTKKKWEQLEAHVTQSEPGVTLVSEADKREAVVFDATNDFENIGENQ